METMSTIRNFEYDMYAYKKLPYEAMTSRPRSYLGQHRASNASPPECISHYQFIWYVGIFR